VFRRIVIAVVVVAASAPAFAADLVGEWTRADGKAKVRFAPCGSAICGMVTWLKDPSGPGRIGQRVFLRHEAERRERLGWHGLQPEDGKDYSGKVTLEA